jgi:glycosyltransferase involved in cell wall biosynthesis
MTSGPRLTIVARRFWPHAGSDTSWIAVRLAVGLASTGYRVRVLTPHHRRESAGYFCYRGIEVRRLISQPRNEWVTGRYSRQWSSLIQTHAADSELLLAVGAREEALGTIAAGQALGIPTLVHPITFGPETDSLAWGQGAAIKRYFQTLAKADQIVVSEASAGRTLVSEGVLPDRITSIAMGIEPPSDDSSGLDFEIKKSEARKVLAGTNLDLAADEDAPVVLCTGAMMQGGPIQCFVDAAMPLVNAHPKVKLWLVGDGPARSRIYERLRGDGLRHSIAMPGSFCQWEDLMSAADIYLHLETTPESANLAEALAHHRIVAIRECPANRLWMKPTWDSEHLAWFDLQPPSLYRALTRLIEHRSSAAISARQYGRTMTRHQPRDQCIRDFQREIQRLIVQNQERKTQAARIGSVAGERS